MRFLAGFMGFLVVTGAASAGEAVLTLPDAIAQALVRNPTYLSQRLDVEKATYEQQAAHGAYWPQLDFGVSATRYGYPTFVIPIRQLGVFPPLDTTIYQYGVALRIPLYLGGRLSQGLVHADIGREIAQEQERLGNQSLVFNISSVYLKIVHLGSLRTVYDARIASLDAQERRVRLLNKVGRAPRLDLLKVGTLLSRARYEQLQVENRRQEAITLLYNLMGDELPATIPPFIAYRTQATEVTPVEALQQEANARRPELRIADRKIASAQTAERMARGERLPSVSVVGQYVERAGANSAFFDDWNVGVQLTVPILDGGIRRAREQQAVAARVQAEEAARNTHLEVNKQVRDAVNAQQEAEARLQVTGRSVAEANETLSIERLKYEQGVGVITDLLDAESAVLMTQADRLQAQFDLLIARLNLLKATGQLDAEKVDQTLVRIDREPS